MNCVDARHLIHLDAGHDLRPDEEHGLAGHMEHCAECRAYGSGMVDAMSALRVLRDFAADPVWQQSRETRTGVRSAWPGLASRLPVKRMATCTPRKFNTRVAALCVCSLALAVVTIIQNLPLSSEPQWSDGGLSAGAMFASPAAQSVGFSQMSPAVRVAAEVPGTIGSSGAAGPQPFGRSFPPGSRFRLLNPDGSVAADFQLAPATPVSGVPRDTPPGHSF